MLVLVEKLRPLDLSAEQERSDTSRQVEQLTTGVVSVSWTLPGGRRDPGRRLHLHVGVGIKPPVELTFDKLDGELIGVQAVLQDEAVIEKNIFGSRLPAAPGLPVVDVNPWRGDEQILDHIFEPIVGWEPFGSLSVQVAHTGCLPSRECVVSGLGVVLDASDLILGFRLPDLAEFQIATIRRADTGE